MIVLALLQNLALLLAVVVGYRVILNRWQQTLCDQEMLSGLVFGGVAVLGMLVPVHLAGGTILDARTVVLALAGAYGGPMVAVVAGVMAILGRLALGGTGALVGVFAVAVAAGGGVVVFRRWSDQGDLPSMGDLWFLAVGVHVALAAAFLTLLDPTGEGMIRDAILLLLFVYPPVTVLAALLFSDYEKQRLQRGELAAKVARNEALWDSMADAALVIDGAGRLQLINRAGEELLGVEASRVRGRPIRDLLFLRHADDARLPPHRLPDLLGFGDAPAGGPTEALFIVRPDGSRCAVEVSGHPVGEGQRGRDGVLVLIRDRSSERRAWRALVESERRMELALEGGELGTWDWNVATGEVRFDERWAEMLGYRVDELAPTIETWRELLHPDDRARTGPAIERHLQDPAAHPYDVRIRLRHRQGHWVWILGRGRLMERAPDGSPLRMTGTQSDITELVEAQERLAESEARFRRIVENAPDLIFRYRFLPEPGFEFVSPSAEGIVGYTPEEHYADPGLGHRIIHPDDWHLLPGPDADWESEQPLKLRWVHKDGRVLWTEQHSVLIRDDEGRAVAVEGIARDVTERHEAEARIRRLAESLEDKVRERTAELTRANNELESFSYSVSHDLKAPLRAIDGYSALLEADARSLDLGDEARELVGEVRRNAARMGELIDGLLTFSRVGRGELADEAVDVDGLVRDLVDEERRRHPGREIELTSAGLGPVRGDPVLLRQALANVLGNAVKFSAPRARTRIAVEGAALGSMLRVRIDDNGVGFDPRYAHKLFRVFERLHHDDEFAGSGVGLATVKRIVERHGGRVHIEGHIDEGTSVFLFLPRAGASAPSGPAAPTESGPAPLGEEAECAVPVA